MKLSEHRRRISSILAESRASSRRFWGRAAAGGVLQRESDGRVLLVHRANVEGDGWGFPGGKIERGDDERECVEAEIDEELGKVPEGKFTGKQHVYSTKMNPGDRLVDEGRFVRDNEDITFTYTFLHYIVTEEDWEPELNWEHDDHGWFDPHKLPAGLFTAVNESGQKVNTVRDAVNATCGSVTKNENFEDFLVNESYESIWNDELAEFGKALTTKIEGREKTFDEFLEEKGIDKKDVGSKNDLLDWMCMRVFSSGMETKRQVGKIDSIGKKVKRRIALMDDYIKTYPNKEIGSRTLDFDKESDRAHVRIKVKRLVMKMRSSGEPVPENLEKLSNLLNQSRERAKE